jgi:hypothetical protein
VTVASLFPDIETAPARKDATLSDCGLYRYDLLEAADPVGPKNDLHIEAHAFCGMTVAAWGAKRRAARRAAGVVARLTAKGRKLYAIRETKSGWPEHPLFLPAHLKPFAWRPTPTP